jgi:CrcB protein
MSVYLAIAFGGSLGAVSRYWVSSRTYLWLGSEFPFGTLMVNVTGSFLMGLLAIILSEKIAVPNELRFALLVGFLGSYTTFSTFALDGLQALNNGLMLKFSMYVLISVTGSLAGVWMGSLAARLILR